MTRLRKPQASAGPWQPTLRPKERAVSAVSPICSPVPSQAAVRSRGHQEPAQSALAAGLLSWSDRVLVSGLPRRLGRDDQSGKSLARPRDDIDGVSS